MVFGMMEDKHEVDPWAQIFLRRCTLFRRMIVKHRHLLQKANLIFKKYQDAGYIGTNCQPEVLAQLKPIPPIGMPNRSAWKPKIPPLGPVGLILYSIHGMGVALGEGFNIHMHNEVPLSLIKTPIQYLKPLLRNIVVHSRFVNTKSREIMANVEELDFHMLRKSISKYADEQLRQIQYHLNLSGWSNDKLASIDRATHHKCQCGAPHQTRRHIVWECPLNKHQHTEQIQALYELGMPNNILHGIPHTLPQHPGKMWKTQDGSNGHLQLTSIARILGLPHVEGTSFNSAVQYLENNQTEQFASLNSRQVFLRHKGHFDVEDYEEPSPCEAAPPSQPNVYTDGSLKVPSMPYLSLGGAGLWFPQRNLVTQPCHTNEEKFADITVEQAGIKLSGAIYGPRASSTRTELASGLFALSAPFAVHMASDSLNFVRMANTLLQDMFWKPPKPWGLMPDGDLWELFQKHATAKGANSIKIVKVKGHANEDHVARGIITAQDRQGNHHADRAADEGVSMHSKPIVALAHAYKHRLHIYQVLLTIIHDHTLLMLRLDKERREQTSLADRLAQNVKPNYMFIAKSLDYHDKRYPGINLSMASPHIYGTLNLQHPFLHVWAFLSQLKFQLCENGQQGTSWLELFVYFELRGGLSDDINQCRINQAISRTSLRKSMATFRHYCKLVMNTCMNHVSTTFMAASKSPNLRLRSLGFNCFVPCISSRICIPDDHAKIIAKALLATRTKITRNKTRDLNAGTLSLPQRKFSYRGVPAWRRLETIDNLVPTTARNIFEDRSYRASVPPPPISFVISCKTCGSSIQASCRKLHHEGKWASLQCSKCCCSRSARQWLCPCKLPWPNCDKHSPSGYRCGHQFRRKSLKRIVPQINTHAEASTIKRARTNGPPLLQLQSRPPRPPIGIGQMMGAQPSNANDHLSPFQGKTLIESAREHFNNMDGCPAGHTALPVVQTVSDHYSRGQGSNSLARTRRPKRPREHGDEQALLAFQRIRDARNQPH